MKDRIVWVRHLIIWVLIIAYLCLLDPIQGDLITQIPVTGLIMLCYVMVFYSVGLFIFPRFWKSNYLFLTFFVIVIYAIFFGITYFNFFFLLPALGGENYFSGISFIEVVWRFLFPFTLVFTPAVGYFFSNLSIKKIETQNEREKSLLLIELNFLKNQFNSHITFNFLNYCYSNVHQVSEKTADAIDLFSRMLRYSLEIRPDEKISIDKEIEYIMDFINLQRLLTAQVFVKFECTGDFKGKMILTRILITFIENAFKHGQINCATDPISISLNGNNSGLDLKVFNKKNIRKNPVNTGVGHKNVLQILQLYYPNSYNIKIEEDLENFYCELNLNLVKND